MIRREETAVSWLPRIFIDGHGVNRNDFFATIQGGLTTIIRTGVENMDSYLELMRRARKQDVSAFAQLYQEIYKDLYKFAFYTLKNPHDAEDVVGDTMIDVFAEMEKGLPVWSRRRALSVCGGWNLQGFHKESGISLSACRTAAYATGRSGTGSDGGRRSAEGGMYAYLFSAIDDDGSRETTDSRMVIPQETEIYTAGESFYLSDLSLPDQFSTWITKVQTDCGKIDVKKSQAVDENMELTAVSDQYGCVIDKQEENGGVILDFSDAENPRAAGAFEGMPFPIFQQFLSEDRLLEIGFEEASDGKTEVKLVMMDLSDPYHVQEKHSGIFVQEGVFRGIDLSSVVMDSEKGRIGFLAETQEHPRGNSLVYEYDEERGFQEVFSKDIEEDFEDEEWIESIFAGDDVYLVSDKKAVVCELPD